MANVYRVSVGGEIHNLSGLIPSGAATASDNQFTGLFPGIVAYIDGVAVFLRNNIADSQNNCTLRINSLGYKPIFLSNDVSQRVSTEWKNGSSGLFIYDTSLDSGNGGWVFYSGDTMTGILTCNNNNEYDTKQARNIYIMADGSSPVGGANGDIALYY